MTGIVDPARDNEVIERSASTLEPSQNAAPGRVEQLEPNKSAGLLLDDIAPAPLAVGRKIKHGPIPEPLILVEPEPNGPDLLWLQSSLRTELPISIPRTPLDSRIELLLSHNASPAAGRAMAKTAHSRGELAGGRTFGFEAANREKLPLV